MTKSKLAMYLFTFSGALFLITSYSYLSLEDSNLAPVFMSLAFAQISLAIFYYMKSRKEDKNCEINELTSE